MHCIQPRTDNRRRTLKIQANLPIDSTSMPRAKAKKQSKKRPARKLAWSVDLNEPLPPTFGPKLGAFDLHDRSIEFIGLLSAEQPGRHSHVFEVVIGSEHYALKMARPERYPKLLLQLLYSTHAVEEDQANISSFNHSLSSTTVVIMS